MARLPKSAVLYELWELRAAHAGNSNNNINGGSHLNRTNERGNGVCVEAAFSIQQNRTNPIHIQIENVYALLHNNRHSQLSCPMIVKRTRCHFANYRQCRKRDVFLFRCFALSLSFRFFFAAAESFRYEKNNNNWQIYSVNEYLFVLTYLIHRLRCNICSYLTSPKFKQHVWYVLTKGI